MTLIQDAHRWWKMFSLQAFAFIAAVQALYGTLVVTKPELVSAPIPLLGWSIASLVIGLTILGAILGFVGRLLQQFDPTPAAEPDFGVIAVDINPAIDPDWTPAALEGAKSMGLPAAPSATLTTGIAPTPATMPSAFDNDAVFARPECVFSYCPNPEDCKARDACRNPSRSAPL